MQCEGGIFTKERHRGIYLGGGEERGGTEAVKKPVERCSVDRGKGMQISGAFFN